MDLWGRWRIPLNNKTQDPDISCNCEYANNLISKRWCNPKEHQESHSGISLIWPKKKSWFYYVWWWLKSKEYYLINLSQIFFFNIIFELIFILFSIQISLFSSFIWVSRFKFQTSARSNMFTNWRERKKFKKKKTKFVSCCKEQ